MTVQALARRTHLTLVLLTGAVLAATPVALSPAHADAAPDVQIEVVGTRPDLVTGGDALIRVTPSAVQLRVNDHVVPVHGGLALATGLHVGTNRLTATIRGGLGARLDVVNHPRGGPVFSGTQVEPWICTTAAQGLGPPQDSQCNAPTVYSYKYKSAGTQTFLAYDSSVPPAAIATTTTDQGITVPYIVRIERGTLNRGIYDIAVVVDPAKTYSPWSPPKSWNHKAVFTFGPGCGPGHSQGIPLDVVQDLGVGRGTPLDLMQDLALGRGWAVASATTSTMGNVCNPIVAAETVMMVKERIAEGYGPIRYTMGDGCSGGSESQNSIAENYPGLLDGIRPTCTFPDAWTPAVFYKSDCDLLEHYFTTTSPQLWNNPLQRAAVLGNPTETHCRNVPDSDIGNEDWDPATGCKNDSAPWMYDARTNPRGTRCTLQDYNVASLGRRADGKANGVLDDVGVQWGLSALRAGQISIEQFVDLNDKVGGWDIDHQHQPARTHGDIAGITRMYTTGQLTWGRNLAGTPSIDARSDNTQDLHGNIFREIVRSRAQRAAGNTAAQVFWTEPLRVPAGVPTAVTARTTFTLMDTWLRAIEVDSTHRSAAQKATANKPSEARDGCVAGGSLLPSTAPCDALYTHHQIARMVAGMPATGDILKCTLAPLTRASIGVPVTDEQWTRLQNAFPTGVCDYSKPGVGQQPPLGDWISLSGESPRPLGPPPTSITLDTSDSRPTAPHLGSKNLAATGGSALTALTGIVLGGLALLSRIYLRHLPDRRPPEPKTRVARTIRDVARANHRNALRSHCGHRRS